MCGALFYLMFRLGLPWWMLLFVMMWQYPAVTQWVLYASLLFPVYYFGLSFVLHVKPRRPRR